MKSQSRQELICGLVPAIICGVIGSFIGWAIGSARAAEMLNPDGLGEGFIGALFYEANIPQLIPGTYAAVGALIGLVVGIFPYCIYRVFVACASQKHIEATSREKLRDALESRKSRG